MVFNLLPAPVASACGFESNDQDFFYPYNMPMNGQTARLEMTREIIEKLGITRVIETGTYKATTTAWFASFGLKVHTVELIPWLYRFSRRRLHDFKNVEIVNSDSIPFLSDFVKRLPEALSEPTLIYLDAHRKGSMPLREELELVRNHFKRAVVIIDDFEVPGDPGYRVDDYGGGLRLTLEFLGTAREGLTVYFPATSSRWETGAKSGCVVLTSYPPFVAELDRFALLKRWQG